MLIHYKYRFGLWIRALCVLIAITFLVEGVAWAYPPERPSAQTLSVQPMFGILSKAVGRQNLKKLEGEMTLIIGDCLQTFRESNADQISCLNINTALDAQSGDPEHHSKKLLALTENPRRLDDGSLVIRLRYTRRRNREFIITFRGKNVEGLMNPSNISVQMVGKQAKLSAKEEKNTPVIARSEEPTQSLPASSSQYGDEFNEIMRRGEMTRPGTFEQARRMNNRGYPEGSLRFLLHTLTMYFNDSPKHDLNDLRSIADIKEDEGAITSEQCDFVRQEVKQLMTVLYKHEIEIPINEGVFVGYHEFDDLTFDRYNLEHREKLRGLIRCMIGEKEKYLAAIESSRQRIQEAIPDEQILSDVLIYFSGRVHDYFNELESAIQAIPEKTGEEGPGGVILGMGLGGLTPWLKKVSPVKFVAAAAVIFGIIFCTTNPTLFTAILHSGDVSTIAYPQSWAAMWTIYTGIITLMPFFFTFNIANAIGHLLAARIDKDRKNSRYIAAIGIGIFLSWLVIPHYVKFIRDAVPDMGIWSHGLRAYADTFIFAYPMNAAVFAAMGVRDKLSEIYENAASIPEFIRSLFQKETWKEVGSYIPEKVSLLHGENAVMKIIVLFWTPILFFSYYVAGDATTLGIAASAIIPFSFIGALFIVQKPGHELTEYKTFNWLLKRSHFAPIAFIIAFFIVSAIFFGPASVAIANLTAVLLWTGGAYIIYQFMDRGISLLTRIWRSRGDDESYDVHLYQIDDLTWRAESRNKTYTYTIEHVREVNDTNRKEIRKLINKIPAPRRWKDELLTQLENEFTPDDTLVILRCGNKAVGLYHFRYHSVMALSVLRGYRGTGAIDVLLNDINNRILHGDESGSFFSDIARKSIHAESGPFLGTLTQFKRALGTRSRVITHGSSSGSIPDPSPNYLMQKRTRQFADNLERNITFGTHTFMPEWRAALFVAPWYERNKIFFRKSWSTGHDLNDYDENSDEMISLLEGWGWVISGGFFAWAVSTYPVASYLRELAIHMSDKTIITAAAWGSAFYVGTIISHFLVNLYRVIHNAIPGATKRPLLVQSSKNVTQPAATTEGTGLISETGTGTSTELQTVQNTQDGSERTIPKAARESDGASVDEIELWDMRLFWNNKAVLGPENKIYESLLEANGGKHMRGFHVKAGSIEEGQAALRKELGKLLKEPEAEKMVVLIQFEAGEGDKTVFQTIAVRLGDLVRQYGRDPDKDLIHAIAQEGGFHKFLLNIHLSYDREAVTLKGILVNRDWQGSGVGTQLQEFLRLYLESEHAGKEFAVTSIHPHTAASAIKNYRADIDRGKYSDKQEFLYLFTKVCGDLDIFSRSERNDVLMTRGDAKTGLFFDILEKHYRDERVAHKTKARNLAEWLQERAQKVFGGITLELRGRIGESRGLESGDRQGKDGPQGVTPQEAEPAPDDAKTKAPVGTEGTVHSESTLWPEEPSENTPNPYHEGDSTSSIDILNDLSDGNIIKEINDRRDLHPDRPVKILMIGVGRGYEAFSLMREFGDTVDITATNKEDMLYRTPQDLADRFEEDGIEAAWESGELIKKLRAPGRYFRCDMDIGCPADGPFEMVIICEGVESHIRNKIPAIEEALRVCETGGTVYCHPSKIYVRYTGKTWRLATYFNDNTFANIETFNDSCLKITKAPDFKFPYFMEESSSEQTSNKGTHYYTVYYNPVNPLPADATAKAPVGAEGTDLNTKAETGTSSGSQAVPDRMIFSIKIPRSADKSNECGIAIRDFIEKNEKLLLGRDRAIHDVLLELAINIMEHGLGGKIEICRKMGTANGSMLRIISVDKGDGLPVEPNELMRRSLASRVRMAEGRGDFRGMGFAVIALEPEHVNIEYGGKFYKRISKDTEASRWFMETGTSDVVSGTRFTLDFVLSPLVDESRIGSRTGPAAIVVDPDNSGDTILNSPDAFPDASQTAAEVLRRIGYFDENEISNATMVDQLKIAPSDNVLCVGPGQVWHHPVACAIRGARVDVVQPPIYHVEVPMDRSLAIAKAVKIAMGEGWYEEEMELGYREFDQTMELHSVIESVRERMNRSIGQDLIGNRIDIDTYQSALQEANIPEKKYSFAFLLSVLDDPSDKRKTDLINALLCSLRDEAVVMISINTAVGDNQIEGFKKHAEKLGYDVRMTEQFEVRDFGMPTVIHKLELKRDNVAVNSLSISHEVAKNGDVTVRVVQDVHELRGTMPVDDESTGAKKVLIDADKVEEAFANGYLKWGETTDEAKRHMLNVVARNMRHEVNLLLPGNFHAGIPECNNKQPIGLLQWAVVEHGCGTDGEALKKLFLHFKIKDIDEILAVQRARTSDDKKKAIKRLAEWALDRHWKDRHDPIPTALPKDRLEPKDYEEFLVAYTTARKKYVIEQLQNEGRDMTLPDIYEEWMGDPRLSQIAHEARQVIGSWHEAVKAAEFPESHDRRKTKPVWREKGDQDWDAVHKVMPAIVGPAGVINQKAIRRLVAEEYDAFLLKSARLLMKEVQKGNGAARWTLIALFERKVLQIARSFNNRNILQELIDAGTHGVPAIRTASRSRGLTRAVELLTEKKLERGIAYFEIAIKNPMKSCIKKYNKERTRGRELIETDGAVSPEASTRQFKMEGLDLGDTVNMLVAEGRISRRDGDIFLRRLKGDKTRTIENDLGFRRAGGRTSKIYSNVQLTLLSYLAEDAQYREAVLNFVGASPLTPAVTKCKSSLYAVIEHLAREEGFMTRQELLNGLGVKEKESTSALSGLPVRVGLLECRKDAHSLLSFRLTPSARKQTGEIVKVLRKLHTFHPYKLNMNHVSLVGYLLAPFLEEPPSGPPSDELTIETATRPTEDGGSVSTINVEFDGKEPPMPAMGREKKGPGDSSESKKGTDPGTDLKTPLTTTQHSDDIIIPRTADWTTVFEDNSKPLKVEVGFGFGHGLLKMAQDNPDNNFIGIEIDSASVRTLAHRIKKDGTIKNLRLVCAPDETAAAHQKAGVCDEMYYIMINPSYHSLMEDEGPRIINDLLKPGGRIFISSDPRGESYGAAFETEGFLNVTNDFQFPHKSENYRAEEAIRFIFEKPVTTGAPDDAGATVRVQSLSQPGNLNRSSEQGDRFISMPGMSGGNAASTASGFGARPTAGRDDRVVHTNTRGAAIRARETAKMVEDALNSISYPSLNNFLKDAAPALKGHQVDMTIDLELIPHEDMDANMAEWARIIVLSNKYGLDVNYIFRPNGDPEFAEKAKTVLLDHIGNLAGFDTEFKNAVKARITDTEREGENVIKVGIMSLEKVKALQRDQLEKGLLPIAMSDGEGDGVPLRDFVAASMIGLSQASCKAAKPADRAGVIREVLPVMQKIYKRLRPNHIVNKETVETMVSGNPTQRKNLAIDLALPPILRAAINKLREVHDRIIDILRNA